MHYYTYAYLREDKTPYYIGKGQGKRIYSKQKYIKPPKDKSRIIYLKQNLTEEQSFKHEIYMIDVFGRKDLGTGILHNRTYGGEGPSGALRSDETRRKLSEAGKGHIVSEETRKKLSDANRGENNPNYGKTRSEETIKKQSVSMSGEKHPNFGKTTSEETKKRMSDANKNPSEKIRRRMSEATKGTKWWHDGCGNRKRMIECPGDGWKPGRKLTAGVFYKKKWMMKKRKRDVMLWV
jgi:hypothetical protein